MDRLSVLGWVLEVDPVATREFVLTAPAVMVPCGCSGCRNFAVASGRLPASLVDLLRKLGAEPDRPSEVVHWAPNQDGTHLYGGWYHVCGRIISGWDESELQLEFQTLDGVQVCFTTKQLGLVPAGFPQPVIQVELIANLPWVLEEAPPE